MGTARHEIVSINAGFEFSDNKCILLRQQNAIVVKHAKGYNN